MDLIDIWRLLNLGILILSIGNVHIEKLNVIFLTTGAYPISSKTLRNKSWLGLPQNEDILGHFVSIL
jgi:hypothetical protein